MAGKKEVSFTISATETARAVFKSVENAFDSLVDKVASLPALFGAALGAAGFGELFKGAIDSAAAAEVAINRVATAVTNAGGDIAAAQPQIDALMASLAKTTTFKDTELLAGFEQLVVVTGDVNKSLGAMSLVADIARQRHIDLSTAATLVGRVIDGNTSMLARYGIVLNNTQDAMQQLQAKFGGFAANEAQTFQGQLERISQGWERFQVALGNAIVGTDAGKAAASALVSGLADLEKWVTANQDKIGSLTMSIVGVAQAIGSALVTAIQNAGPALDVLAGGFIWLKEKMDDATGDTNVQKLRTAMQQIAQSGFANAGTGMQQQGAAGFDQLAQRVLSTIPNSDAAQTALRNLAAAVNELSATETAHLKSALEGFRLQQVAAGTWSDSEAKNYAQVIGAINQTIAAQGKQPKPTGTTMPAFPNAGESEKDREAVKQLSQEVQAFADSVADAGDKGAAASTKVIDLMTKVGDSKMTFVQQATAIDTLTAALAKVGEQEAAKAFVDAMRSSIELTGDAVDKLNEKWAEEIARLQQDKATQIDPAKAQAIQVMIDKLTAAQPAAIAFSKALAASQDSLAALSEKVKEDGDDLAALSVDISSASAIVATWQAKVNDSTLSAKDHKTALEELKKAQDLLTGAVDAYGNRAKAIGKESTDNAVSAKQQLELLERTAQAYGELADSVISAAGSMGAFSKSTVTTLEDVVKLTVGVVQLFEALGAASGSSAPGSSSGSTIGGSAGAGAGVGAAFGGIGAAIGAIVGAIGGLVETINAAKDAQKSFADANIAALNKLTETLGLTGREAIALSGTQLEQASALTESIKGTTGKIVAEQLTPAQLNLLNTAADALGIKLDGSAGALQSLIDALNEATSATTLFGSSVASQESLGQMEQHIFGDTGAKAIADELGSAISASPALKGLFGGQGVEAFLGGGNGDPAQIASALAGIKALMQQVAAGSASGADLSSLLGGLTPSQFTDTLTQLFDALTNLETPAATVSSTLSGLSADFTMFSTSADDQLKQTLTKLSALSPALAQLGQGLDLTTSGGIDALEKQIQDLYSAAEAGGTGLDLGTMSLQDLMSALEALMQSAQGAAAGIETAAQKISDAIAGINQDADVLGTSLPDQAQQVATAEGFDLSAYDLSTAAGVSGAEAYLRSLYVATTDPATRAAIQATIDAIYKIQLPATDTSSSSGALAPSSDALAASVTQGVTSSVSSAVSAVVTDQTALMLVDLQRSSLSALNKIEQNTRGGGANGGGGAAPVVIQMENNFGPNFDQGTADKIIDDLRTALDKAFGHQIDLQYIHVGSVAR